MCGSCPAKQSKHARRARRGRGRARRAAAVVRGGASSGPCVPQGAVVRAEGVGRGWVVILGAWVVSVTHQRRRMAV